MGESFGKNMKNFLYVAVGGGSCRDEHGCATCEDEQAGDESHECLLGRGREPGTVAPPRKGGVKCVATNSFATDILLPGADGGFPTIA